MPKHSTKHLKPHQFKKGAPSANPHGARLHNPVTKALKSLTIETYRECIEKVCTGNIAALQDMIKDPSVSALQVGIATAFVKALQAGDYATIERIAERIVGKIPDELNVHSKNLTLHSEIDPEKIKAALAKLESDV